MPAKMIVRLLDDADLRKLDRMLVRKRRLRIGATPHHSKVRSDPQHSEITCGDLKRRRPHHVLPAEKVRGLTNSEVIFWAAGVLSARRLVCVAMTAKP